jgi:hypothetical protein
MTEEDHPQMDGREGNLMTAPGDLQVAIPGENP